MSASLQTRQQNQMRTEGELGRPNFRERHRKRLELEAQRDSLCAQLNQLYRDVRVAERGVAEIEKKLEVL